MVASIGTGRYREFAQAALESGLQFFGGDCDPSFHLLTDNVSGIAANLNPQFVPYRPWYRYRHIAVHPEPASLTPS